MARILPPCESTELPQKSLTRYFLPSAGIFLSALAPDWSLASWTVTVWPLGPGSAKADAMGRAKHSEKRPRYLMLNCELVVSWHSSSKLGVFVWNPVPFTSL